MRSLLLPLVVVLLLAGAAHAQPQPGTTDVADAAPGEPADPEAPTVSASLDRAEAHLGDQLTLTVTAVAATAVANTVQLAKPALGKFEVLDSSQADQDLGDGRKSRRFVLQIAAYELGDLEIPAVTVDYSSAAGAHTRSTAPIPVRVVKLVEDDKAELQPLAHSREVMVEDRRPLQALLGAGILLGVVIVGLVARALIRRLRRRAVEKAQAPVPRRPAHEVALERLAELRRRGDFAADSYQPFHFEVAEIVRAFLGERHGFDSLELTTTELCEELGEARATRGVPGGIADELLDRVRRFLEACDLVKFAKAPSSDAECLVLLDEAEAVVRASHAAMASAATDAGGPQAESNTPPATGGADGNGTDGPRVAHG